MRTFPLLTLLLIPALFAGCQSSKPSSASFASVVFKGRTADQIHQTTIAVFTAEGYRQIVYPGSAELVFEREGTRGEQISYGGVVGDREVRVRVRAVLVPLAQDQYRLQCKAYMVRDAGSSIEDEVRLKNFRSGPYQRLLDEIAKRLGS